VLRRPKAVDGHQQIGVLSYSLFSYSSDSLSVYSAVGLNHVRATCMGQTWGIIITVVLDVSTTNAIIVFIRITQQNLSDVLGFYCTILVYSTYC
jgi:hypothetical protein